MHHRNSCVHFQGGGPVITSDVQQIRTLAESGFDINIRCADGASALFNAVLIANVEVVRTLLELGDERQVF